MWEESLEIFSRVCSESLNGLFPGTKKTICRSSYVRPAQFLYLYKDVPKTLSATHVMASQIIIDVGQCAWKAPSLSIFANPQSILGSLSNQRWIAIPVDIQQEHSFDETVSTYNHHTKRKYLDDFFLKSKQYFENKLECVCFLKKRKRIRHEWIQQLIDLLFPSGPLYYLGRVVLCRGIDTTPKENYLILQDALLPLACTFRLPVTEVQLLVEQKQFRRWTDEPFPSIDNQIDEQWANFEWYGPQSLFYYVRPIQMVQSPYPVPEFEGEQWVYTPIDPRKNPILAQALYVKEENHETTTTFPSYVSYSDAITDTPIKCESLLMWPEDTQTELKEEKGITWPLEWEPMWMYALLQLPFIQTEIQKKIPLDYWTNEISKGFFGIIRPTRSNTICNDPHTPRMHLEIISMFFQTLCSIKGWVNDTCAVCWLLRTIPVYRSRARLYRYSYIEEHETWKSLSPISLVEHAKRHIPHHDPLIAWIRWRESLNCVFHGEDIVYRSLGDNMGWVAATPKGNRAHGCSIGGGVLITGALSVQSTITKLLLEPIPNLDTWPRIPIYNEWLTNGYVEQRLSTTLLLTHDVHSWKERLKDSNIYILDENKDKVTIPMNIDIVILSISFAHEIDQKTEMNLDRIRRSSNTPCMKQLWDARHIWQSIEWGRLVLDDITKNTNSFMHWISPLRWVVVLTISDVTYYTDFFRTGQRLENIHRLIFNRSVEYTRNAANAITDKLLVEYIVHSRSETTHEIEWNEDCFVLYRQCVSKMNILANNQRITEVMNVGRLLYSFCSSMLNKILLEDEIQKIADDSQPTSASREDFIQLESRTCPVCLLSDDEINNVSTREWQQTTCNHFVCGRCMFQIRGDFQQEWKCPLCRTEHKPTHIQSFFIPLKHTQTIHVPKNIVNHPKVDYLLNLVREKHTRETCFLFFHSVSSMMYVHHVLSLSGISACIMNKPGTRLALHSQQSSYRCHLTMIHDRTTLPVVIPVAIFVDAVYEFEGYRSIARISSVIHRLAMKNSIEMHLDQYLCTKPNEKSPPVSVWVTGFLA